MIGVNPHSRLERCPVEADATAYDAYLILDTVGSNASIFRSLITANGDKGRENGIWQLFFCIPGPYWNCDVS